MSWTSAKGKVEPGWKGGKRMQIHQNRASSPSCTPLSPCQQCGSDGSIYDLYLLWSVVHQKFQFMMTSPRWLALRQLILEEEAFCFSTTAFCLMSTRSTHYCLPPHIKPLFCHIWSSSPQTSFRYIHTSTRHLKPKMESQSFHFSFFFFRPAEQHQTWPQWPPDCKSVPQTDNAVQIGYKQQTTNQRYMRILKLILRCNSSMAVEAFPSERVILIYWPRSSKEN